MTHGCCADGVCDKHTCMALPKRTCGDCVHYKPTCSWLLSAKPDNTSCSWYPRRFRLASKGAKQ